MKRKLEDVQNNAQEDESDSDDDDFGPSFALHEPTSGENSNTNAQKKRKRTLAHEKVFLSKLPSGQLYERSYLHRDVITHVAIARSTDFILTASRDGCVKFWKKTEDGIEFVKTFKAHILPITSLTVSQDGKSLCTTAYDRTIKIYSVLGCDMLDMIDELSYFPANALWCQRTKPPIDTTLVVSEMQSSVFHIYSVRSGATSTTLNGQRKKSLLEKLCVVSNHHSSPIRALTYSQQHDCVISIEQKGIIEYWHPRRDYAKVTKESNLISFDRKFTTDLYDLAKAQSLATSVTASPNGKHFCVTSADSKIRVFNFRSGKLLCLYDESSDVFANLQSQGKLIGIDTIEFGRRAAVENDINKACSEAIQHQRDLQSDVTKQQLDNGGQNDDKGNPGILQQLLKAGGSAHLSKTMSPPPSNCVFDDSGHFLLYPTLYGIKIVNLVTHKVRRVLGKLEASERFLGIALYQGIPAVDSQRRKSHKHSSKAVSQEEISRGGASLEDPTLFCLAFNRKRFFMFTRREPDGKGDGLFEGEGRDVFNERPDGAIDANGNQSSSNVRRIQEAEANRGKGVSHSLPRKAIIRTTMGDMELKLFPDEAPKTVENFVTHAKNRYYDNVIFHRVIKTFMIQTGDPKGNGTGGESIWGGTFEDEFHSIRRHDKAGIVSMANAGPGTNGSQFFITCIPTPWLNDKHTVFAQVVHGLPVVKKIENVPTDKVDKPLDPIHILNIDVFMS
eukprot:g1514.t1